MQVCATQEAALSLALVSIPLLHAKRAEHAPHCHNRAPSRIKCRLLLATLPKDWHPDTSTHGRLANGSVWQEARSLQPLGRTSCGASSGPWLSKMYIRARTDCDRESNCLRNGLPDTAASTGKFQSWTECRLTTCSSTSCQLEKGQRLSQRAEVDTHNTGLGAIAGAPGAHACSISFQGLPQRHKVASAGGSKLQ